MTRNQSIGDCLINVGTSGWHYAHWKDRYYPRGLSSDRWLSYYAKTFSCVEINASFYRLPREETVRSWVEQTPETFRFAVKASRLITHMKKLHECAQILENFLAVVAKFEGKLGPILFQLPPHWRVHARRLEQFLTLLPSHHHYAFEFRDASWHTAEIYALLKAHNAAFCQFELAGFQSPDPITADFIYIRLHGPGSAYGGSYTVRALSNWARKLNAWRSRVREIYLLFDNDELGYAVHNARLISDLCGEQLKQQIALRQSLKKRHA